MAFGILCRIADIENLSAGVAHFENFVQFDWLQNAAAARYPAWAARVCSGLRHNVKYAGASGWSAVTSRVNSSFVIGCSA